LTVRRLRSFDSIQGRQLPLGFFYTDLGPCTDDPRVFLRRYGTGVGSVSGKPIRTNAESPKINNTTYATLFQTIQHSCITVGILRIDATIENQSKPSLVMTVSRGGGVKSTLDGLQLAGKCLISTPFKAAFVRVQTKCLPTESHGIPSNPRTGRHTIIVLFFFSPSPHLFLLPRRYFSLLFTLLVPRTCRQLD